MGKAVLGAVEEGKSLIGQPQCLVRIAEQPQTPGAIGKKGSAQVDAVFIGKARRLFDGKGAIKFDGLIEMGAGMGQSSKMQFAERHTPVPGDTSPDVVRPPGPLEHLVGSHH